MSTETEPKEGNAEPREQYIRVEGLGREEKLALEDEVGQPGREYAEASWRKTSKEGLPEIRREIDRMRGIDPNKRSDRRRARTSASPTKVPPGVRTRVTDALGPIAETEVVYVTKRSTVLRAVLLEDDRRRVLILVDEDGVREVDDIERIIDGMPEEGHPATEPPTPPEAPVEDEGPPQEEVPPQPEAGTAGGGLHWRGWTQKYEQDIDAVEGIGDTYAAQLRAKGINRIGDMVLAGRERVESVVDAPPQVVGKWFAMADLMRVRDVGTQFSELLVRAGVTGVDDLAKREPDELTEVLLKYQGSVDVTIQGAPVHEQRVRGWIANARTMVLGLED